MSTLLPCLTFRVIRMHCASTDPGKLRYVAVAWNYDVGQLMATKPLATYTYAREALDTLVTERRCKLRWFDGEYDCYHDGAQLTPVADPSLPRETEDDIVHQA